MAETINDNVNVTGGFSAGNWLFGTAKVPISSTTEPSMQSVQGLNPMGTGEGYPSMGLGGLVTSRSAYPGHRVKGDRKSTRLNSSHVKISYAVFCLKKKTAPNPSYIAHD